MDIDLRDPGTLRTIADNLELAYFGADRYSRDSAIGTKVENLVLKLRQVANIVEVESPPEEEIKPVATNIRNPNSLRQTAFDLEQAYFRSNDNINPNSELAMRLAHAIATLRWAAGFGDMKEPATWDSFQIDDIVRKEPETGMEIKFNINHLVRVKLTNAGMDVLKERHRTNNVEFDSVAPFKEPATDDEGYSTIQLYNLMNIFGPYLKVHSWTPYFDGNDIVIDKRDTVDEPFPFPTDVDSNELDLNPTDREMLEEILDILKPEDEVLTQAEPVIKFDLAEPDKNSSPDVMWFKSKPNREGERLDHKRVYRVHPDKVNKPHEKGERNCLMCETRLKLETAEHWCCVITDDLGDSYICHYDDWLYLDSFDHLKASKQALCDVCVQTTFVEETGYIVGVPLIKLPDA